MKSSNNTTTTNPTSDKSNTSSNDNTTTNSNKMIIVLRYNHEKFLRTRPDLTNQIQRFYPSTHNSKASPLQKQKKKNVPDIATPGSSSSRQTYDPTSEPNFAHYPPLRYNNSTPTPPTDKLSLSFGSVNAAATSDSTISNTRSNPFSIAMLKRSNSDVSIASSTHWSLNDMDDSIQVNYHDHSLNRHPNEYNNSSSNMEDVTQQVQQQVHRNDYPTSNIMLSMLPSVPSSSLLLSSSSHQHQIRERIIKPQQQQQLQSFTRNSHIKNQLTIQLQEENQRRSLLNQWTELNEQQNQQLQQQQQQLQQQQLQQQLQEQQQQHTLYQQQHQQLDHRQQQQQLQHQQQQHVTSASHSLQKSSLQQQQASHMDPYHQILQHHLQHPFLDQSQLSHMIIQQTQLQQQQQQPQLQNDIFQMESRNVDYSGFAAASAVQDDHQLVTSYVPQYTDHTRRQQRYDNQIRASTINDTRQQHHLSLPSSLENQLFHSEVNNNNQHNSFIAQHRDVSGTANFDRSPFKRRRSDQDIRFPAALMDILPLHEDELSTMDSNNEEVPPTNTSSLLLGTRKRWHSAGSVADSSTLLPPSTMHSSLPSLPLSSMLVPNNLEDKLTSKSSDMYSMEHMHYNSRKRGFEQKDDSKVPDMSDYEPVYSNFPQTSDNLSISGSEDNRRIRRISATRVSVQQSLQQEQSSLNPFRHHQSYGPESERIISSLSMDSHHHQHHHHQQEQQQQQSSTMNETGKVITGKDDEENLQNPKD